MHTACSLLDNQWGSGSGASRQDRLSGAEASRKDSAGPVGGRVSKWESPNAPSMEILGPQRRTFRPNLKTTGGTTAALLAQQFSRPATPQNPTSPRPPVPAGGLSLIQVALEPASQTLVWPWITGNAVKTEVRNQGSWGA